MKNQIFGLFTFLLSSYAVAGAVTSGGGSPPPPVVYPEAFEYSCHIRIDRIQATSKMRNEGAIEADYILKYDLKNARELFSGNIPLGQLNWKNVETNQAVKIAPQDHALILGFEMINSKYAVTLRLQVTQQSESGQYELNTYKITKMPFDSTQALEVEGNVEERANWINNQPPKGLSMNYTGVSASCERIQ
jgi:hypothetical protein